MAEVMESSTQLETGAKSEIASAAGNLIELMRRKSQEIIERVGPEKADLMKGLAKDGLSFVKMIAKPIIMVGVTAAITAAVESTGFKLPKDITELLYYVDPISSTMANNLSLVIGATAGIAAEGLYEYMLNRDKNPNPIHE